MDSNGLRSWWSFSLFSYSFWFWTTARIYRTWKWLVIRFLGIFTASILWLLPIFRTYSQKIICLLLKRIIDKEFFTKAFYVTDISKKSSNYIYFPSAERKCKNKNIWIERKTETFISFLWNIKRDMRADSMTFVSSNVLWEPFFRRSHFKTFLLYFRNLFRIEAIYTFKYLSSAQQNGTPALRFCMQLKFMFEIYKNCSHWQAEITTKIEIGNGKIKIGN